MSRKQAAIALIIVSLAFAVAILITSYLLADSNNAQTVTFILIAIWFIPFSVLSAKAAKK